MANKSFTTLAADMTTNATALAASDSDITAGEWAAIAALCTLLAKHPCYSVPMLKLLSDTNRALLAPG